MGKSWHTSPHTARCNLLQLAPCLPRKWRYIVQSKSEVLPFIIILLHPHQSILVDLARLLTTWLGSTLYCERGVTFTHKNQTKYVNIFFPWFQVTAKSQKYLKWLKVTSVELMSVLYHTGEPKTISWNLEKTHYHAVAFHSKSRSYNERASPYIFPRLHITALLACL